MSFRERQKNRSIILPNCRKTCLHGASFGADVPPFSLFWIGVALGFLPNRALYRLFRSCYLIVTSCLVFVEKIALLPIWTKSLSRYPILYSYFDVAMSCNFFYLLFVGMDRIGFTRSAGETKKLVFGSVHGWRRNSLVFGVIIFCQHHFWTLSQGPKSHSRGKPAYGRLLFLVVSCVKINSSDYLDDTPAAVVVLVVLLVVLSCSELEAQMTLGWM